jgi:predicted choloylglycine hydrolase
MRLKFRGLTEDAPGDAWRSVVEDGWPGWRSWFMARGGARAPKLADAGRALRRHMPEMEPLWQRLVDTADGDDDLARFLSFWTPPRYLVSCSQAVIVDDDGPLLIRNYDLDPDLNESTMLHSAWRGRRVMGMVEGLAGLADGMNDAGLAASLTFGGRTVSGRGFGIPLIMRYLLEVCNDTADAVELLRAVPCHMSYNVTVADRSGRWATVFLAPDRPAIVTDRRAATNHQLAVEWPRHGRVSRTLERERHLDRLLAGGRLTGADATAEFKRGPLFSTGYAKAFGTVYTAAYRPATGEATLSWREGPAQTWNMRAFEPAEVTVDYSARGSAVLAGPAGAQAGTQDWLDAFLGELSHCVAGRDWSRLGRFWQAEHDWSRASWRQPPADSSAA